MLEHEVVQKESVVYLTPCTAESLEKFQCPGGVQHLRHAAPYSSLVYCHVENDCKSQRDITNN